MTGIDFDEYARGGKTYDALLKAITKKVNGLTAAQGLLFILCIIALVLGIVK